MPRLTTQENLNNYRASSLWYRDGSFLKLRNLLVAYTFPKSQTRFADLKVFVQGTNLFSLDNLHFADRNNLASLIRRQEVIGQVSNLIFNAK